MYKRQFLDRVAARGVRFASAHAPSQHTAPSHMSLFTGLDPMGHQVRNPSGPDSPLAVLHEDLTTLPELLQRGGYRTVAVTDRGNLQPAMGFDRGFDRHEAFLDELPRKLKLVREVLEGEPADEPLFLFFHTYAIHSPYLPKGRFHGLFTDPAYGGTFRERYDAIAPLPPLDAWGESKDFLKTWEGMDETDVAWLSDLYDEGIAYADDQIGRLWQLWSRHRDPEDTLLVITSDHGEEFWEHGALGHRRGLYRELVHVPLILDGPDLGSGVVAQPVALTGLFATLLEYLDLPCPEVQVDSFLPLALDPGAPLDPGPVYGQAVGSRRAGQYEAVSEAELRLVRRAGQRGGGSALYPWTPTYAPEVDAAAERPQDVERLQALLNQRRLEGIALQRKYPPGRGATRGEELLRELSALGYFDGEDE